MQPILRRLLKWLGYFALGCYVVLAVAFIGLRYWVLPNIDHWREPLQNELSSMLSARVELGRVSADWFSAYPRIQVADVHLQSESGRRLLHIPTLQAVIGWQALLTGRIRFVDLHADGVELTLRRDAQDRIQVLGHEVDGDGSAPSSVRARDNNANHDRGGANGNNLLEWLAEQGDVRLSNATVRWLDESRGAPALVFEDVSVMLGREGETHHFSMLARPPASLGRSFSLQAQVGLHAIDGRAPTLQDLNGLFYVGVENMQPAAWNPWLDSYSVLDQGEVSWKAWQEVRGGKPQRHVTRVTVKNGVWSPMAGSRVAAVSAVLHLEGPWSELKEIWSGVMVEDRGEKGGESGDPVVRVVTKLEGLHAEFDGIFDAPLAFNAIALTGEASHETDTGLKLSAERLQLQNADMDLEIRGNWQELGGAQAGLIDLEGQFNWAKLAAIVRYLPNEVDEDARQWLHHGLLAGTLLQAPVILQGDLLHFPFGGQPDAGDFKIGGRVQGAVIDYAPAALIGPPGWPRLENLSGRAELHRVDLRIVADSMHMQPGGNTTISLRDVSARIADIERGDMLDVQGRGQAEAAAFLTLLREPPLGGLLGDVFHESKGKGNWEVPISLKIPLVNTDETKVAGSVIFKDAELQLADAFPGLTQLNGRVDFTEEGLLAHELKAKALGGPIAVTGGLGPGTKGLSFSGNLRADALDSYLEGRLQGLAQGSTPYRLTVQRNAGGTYGINLQASLEGLALSLPPPLSKPAAQRWPLSVKWAPASGKKSGTLDINLEKRLAAQFLHRADSSSPSFFHAGVINVQGKARPAAAGLAVDVVAPEVDIDAWRQFIDAVGGADAPAAANGSPRSMLPPLRDLRLQAERAQLLGMDLHHFTFTARRPEGERWRVDVSSTETAGTLFWQERQGRIQGNVDAHFQRLAVGNGRSGKGAAGSEPNDKGAPAWEFDGEIDIPAIQLRVDRLRLYGRDVGKVSVVGVNEAQGRRWKLEQLEITSPHASLKGHGSWQLAGSEGGLRLQADAMFDDLGAYLGQLGFPDLVQGGHGSVRGLVEWRGIPRKFERSGLYGDLNVDLAKGRFVSVSSRSGRLLELLSLQSVQRLAKLDWNPGGLMQQGFPFDTLQGNIKANSGVLHSENYRVSSPVANIVMAGDVDLVKEDLDVYAVVVPTLDVSGAAIAAGIAVNPIVGVGAFLTQWLLKDPLSKAMTVEYRVKGSFDQPQLAEISPK